MKLMTTKDRELNYLRAILYGDSGVGKTTSIKTLPADRTLVLLAERGAVPLREHDYKALQLEQWPDIQMAGAWLKSPDNIQDAAIKKVVDETKIVVVDSLSAVAYMAMRYILEVEKKALADKRGKTAAIKNYEEQMAMEDWGLLRSRMQKLLSFFCQLPYHVIFTSLAAWSQDGEGGPTLRTPALSGKLAQECPAYFDLVLHMESTTPNDNSPPTRRWRTSHSGRIIAKDASGALDRFEDADWQAVFSKIIGTKGGAK